MSSIYEKSHWKLYYLGHPSILRDSGSCGLSAASNEVPMELGEEGPYRIPNPPSEEVGTEGPGASPVAIKACYLVM